MNFTGKEKITWLLTLVLVLILCSIFEKSQNYQHVSLLKSIVFSYTIFYPFLVVLVHVFGLFSKHITDLTLSKLVAWFALPTLPVAFFFALKVKTLIAEKIGQTDFLPSLTLVWGSLGSVILVASFTIALLHHSLFNNRFEYARANSLKFIRIGFVLIPSILYLIFPLLALTPAKEIG